MNVYDFDGTIYDGDATVGFVFYTLRHHPAAMLRALPKQITAVVSYLAGKSSKTELKSRFSATCSCVKPNFIRSSFRFKPKIFKRILLSIV